MFLCHRLGLMSGPGRRDLHATDHPASALGSVPRLRAEPARPASMTARRGPTINGVTIADVPCVWLTTLRRDGSPHTAPTWFLLIDETFWIASSTVNVKVKNLQRDPRVSLAIDGSGAMPHVAQGRAVVHQAIPHFPHLVAAFAEKYNGWDAADETQDGPRVLIEIPIDRWLLETH